MILFCLEIEADKDCPPDTEKSHNTGLVVYVIEPSNDMIFSLIFSICRRPLPFKCVTRPRFPDADAILAQTKELGL